MTTNTGRWNSLRSGAAAVGLGAALAVAGSLQIAEPAERRAERALGPAAVVAEVTAQPQLAHAAVSDEAPAEPRALRSQGASSGGRVAAEGADRETWRLSQRPGDGYLWSRGHESGG